MKYDNDYLESVGLVSCLFNGKPALYMLSDNNKVLLPYTVDKSDDFLDAFILGWTCHYRKNM